jgi:hypothetical protein
MKKVISIKSFIKRVTHAMGSTDQSGSSAIVFTIFLSAASFLGVSHLINQAVESNKNVKLEQRKEQARQTPFNVAAIAKQLVSPGVDDGSPLWKTSEIVSNPNIVPRLYLDPYVPSQAVINATESINSYWKVMEGPVDSSFGEKAWDASLFAAQKKISIFSADSNLLVPVTLEDIYSKASVPTAGVGPTLKFPRSTSLVRYTAKNCNAAGEPSTTWTGYYCVDAEISSQNNSALSGGSSSGINERLMDFGLIQPPPPPVCHGVTAPATWSRGVNIDLSADATGVVAGYRVSVKNSNGEGGVALDRRGIYTAANGLRTRANVAGISVPTDDLAAFPAGDTVTLKLELLNPTGASIVDPAGGPRESCPDIVIKAAAPPPPPICNNISAPFRASGTNNCSMTVSNTGGPVTGSPVLSTIADCTVGTVTPSGKVLMCAVVADPDTGISSSVSSSEISGVTWTKTDNIWVSENIPCPVGSTSEFQVKLTGLGGESSCSALQVSNNGRTCTIAPSIVGVNNLLTGGAYTCKVNSRTINDAIVLPADATEINVKIIRYGVDDWNPCTSLNGTSLGCNRAEKTVCTSGGPGPRVTEFNKDISSILRPGANSLYVESFNKHTLWSMWIGITGTYKTQGATCTHSVKAIP